MSNNIQTAYDQIKKFNLIAGNLTPVNHEQTLDGLFNQAGYIQSELDEFMESMHEHDSVNLVKEACDIFVVASGLLQRLEAAGVNIEKALTRVNDNNLSKFPSTFEHDNNPDLQPENTKVLVTPYGHVAYKRELDGKVLKPTNYVACDVASCAIPDLFEDKE